MDPRKRESHFLRWFPKTGTLTTDPCLPPPSCWPTPGAAPRSPGAGRSACPRQTSRKQIPEENSFWTLHAFFSEFHWGSSLDFELWYCVWPFGLVISFASSVRVRQNDWWLEETQHELVSNKGPKQMAAFLLWLLLKQLRKGMREKCQISPSHIPPTMRQS